MVGTVFGGLLGGIVLIVTDRGPAYSIERFTARLELWRLRCTPGVSAPVPTVKSKAFVCTDSGPDQVRGSAAAGAVKPMAPATVNVARKSLEFFMPYPVDINCPNPQAITRPTV